MVLKSILRIFFFIFCFTTIKANTLGKLIYTDNYGNNYYIATTSSNSKIIFASDILSILDDNGKQILKLITDEFLKKENLTPLESSFTESSIIYQFNNLSYGMVNKLSYNWNLKFSYEWEKLALQQSSIFFSNHQFSTFKKAYLSKVLVDRNYVSKQNQSFITAKLAFVVSNQEKNKFSNNVAYNKTNFPLKDNFIYSESIIVNECMNESILISGPNSNAFLKDKIVFYLTNQILSIVTNTTLNYGVSKSCLVLENNEAITNGNIDTIFSLQNFKNAKESSGINFTKELFNTNLFFILSEKEKWQSSLDSINYDYFKVRLNQILQFNKLFIYSENTSRNELSGLWIFEDTVQMKQNSYKMNSGSDSVLINQIYNFTRINPKAKIAIIGYANDSEYLKIENRNKKAMVNLYNKKTASFESSKKSNLQLIRSIYVFNQLISKGANPENLRCIGYTLLNDDKVKSGVSFMLNQ